jgi:diguanylate cyclase (GGDEF)-like protein
MLTDNAPTHSGRIGAIDADAALDTTAALLRALAHVDEGSRDADRLEAWAQHLLLLTPPPDILVDGEHDRDWGGARRAGVAHIESSAAKARKDVQDLGDVIWSLVEGTSKIVLDGVALDGTTETALTRLKESVALPPDELKLAALDAVTTLTDVLEQRAQTATLDATLLTRIDQLTTELTQAKRDAELDPLTGLASRRELDRELARAVSLNALSGDATSLLLIDLDSFKQINDTHGHAAGDAALTATAEVLTRAFPRASDMVARYGGDEFVVVLRYATESDAKRLAERFLDEVYELVLELPGGETASIRASVGATQLRRGDSPASVVARADAAMYRAKRNGGNRVSGTEERSSRD